MSSQPAEFSAVGTSWACNCYPSY